MTNDVEHGQSDLIVGHVEFGGEGGAGLGFREAEWVADQLGLDKNTVYRYLNDGRLPGLQLGKKWLVEEQGLRDFLRREQQLQTARRQAGGAALGADANAWDGTVTILFSDIDGSSRLIERLGDGGWLELMRRHDQLLHEQLPESGHSHVKSMGDGFMVAFRSATEAVRFAVGFQRAVRAEAQAHPDTAFTVKLGLHAGEVRAEAGEFAGRTLFVAAYIGGRAEPGQTLVSGVVRELCEAPDIRFGEGFEADLRVGGPRTLYPVLWE